jgi:hypothetical protein
MMTDPKTGQHGALFVTEDSEDPRFNQPYTDVREWRDEPADAPVFPGGITTQHGGAAPVQARHLYIHGGFTGTDAKFSFCFRSAEEYQGRFFQATHQLLAGEEATPRNVAFALARRLFGTDEHGRQRQPSDGGARSQRQVRHDVLPGRHGSEASDGVAVYQPLLRANVSVPPVGATEGGWSSGLQAVMLRSRRPRCHQTLHPSDPTMWWSSNSVHHSNHRRWSRRPQQ